MRVPWSARRFNQSILEEISPGCSLVGMMLKLKLQYFGHLTRRVDSLEKTLMPAKTESRRKRECNYVIDIILYLLLSNLTFLLSYVLEIYLC